jgi:hypothetical protein
MILILMILIISTHQQADMARKDRLARSLSLPKLKFPFPNMVRFFDDVSMYLMFIKLKNFIL